MRLALILIVIAACGPSRPSMRVTKFSGRVTEESGKPIKGMTIIVNPTRRKAGSSNEYRKAFTDEAGEFRFDVAPDRYTVSMYYLDLTAEREVEVRGPTVMTQSVPDYHNMVYRCTNGTAASCITPDQAKEISNHRRKRAEEAERAKAQQERDEAKRERAIKPASLSTSGLVVDRGSLTVGASNTITLTVENRGGTAARDVGANTRSSIASLHDLTFSFGVLEPGKKAMRSMQVTLPADISGDAATVVLVFSEAGGHVPANVSQQINLARPLCPTKITRAEYDRKRARLQKQVDDGSLTRDEFIKLDTELVACIR